jgi:hypothetical protein
MKGLREAVDASVVTDAVVSGSIASVLSAAALSYCSKHDEGSVAGGLNGPSQWLWGEQEAYSREATLRHTAAGYTIHHATSIVWALIYEHAFGRARQRDPKRVTNLQAVSEAAVIATAAYLADYKIAPKRLQPGFDKHMSGRSMFAVYVAFGAGLAIATLLRRR